MTPTSGEIQLIAELKKIFGTPSQPLLGIGDDAALFQSSPGKDLVWTIDSQIENVHFKWDWIKAQELGERTLIVTVSDLLAMGAKPRFALVSFHLGRSTDPETVIQVAKGIQSQARKLNMIILGGNVSKSESFSIDCSSVGEVASGQALKRDGAKPGDDVYVTGYPGTAALALACLNSDNQDLEAVKKIVECWKLPTLRTTLSESLKSLATSCIDISDGLIGDAQQIADQSGVVIDIQIDQLPMTDMHERAALILGRDIEEFFLAPSDDYELLFTAPVTHRDDLARFSSEPVSRVGKVHAGSPAVRLQKGGVTIVPNGRFSWDHLC